MWKTQELSAVAILFILVVSSFLVGPVLSQNTTTQTIQAQGVITYPSPPPPPPASSEPLLHTNGVYIEDGSGNRITLKGAQADWNERVKEQGATWEASSPDDAWFTEEDVIRMKAAGANVVEIHVLPLAHLMVTRNVVNTAYFSTWVDTWVQWCSENEMYCILDVTGIGAREDWEIALTFPDWLWSGLGYSTPQTKEAYDAIMRDFFDLDVSVQDTNRQAFTNLWRFIANRYKDNPYVMFSIMNEPFLGSTIHLNPTNDNIALAQDYSTFMETIIDAIRTEGAQQIIIVNHPWLHEPSWAWAVQPINRDNIMWEVHRYITSTSDNFGEWSSNAVTGIDAYVQLYMNGFNQPVFVGEYGFDSMSIVLTDYSGNWQELLANQVAYMQSKQVAGMQWHQWGYIYGEYYHYSANEWAGSLSEAESEYIIQTVLGG